MKGSPQEGKGKRKKMWIYLFQRKESDEEKKMKEKMTFYCLELSKMVKERKNLVGPTSKSLPLTYGRKGRDTSIF